MSLQPNDPDQIPRCACGARILNNGDDRCTRCAILDDNENVADCG